MKRDELEQYFGFDAPAPAPVKVTAARLEQECLRRAHSWELAMVSLAAFLWTVLMLVCVGEVWYLWPAAGRIAGVVAELSSLAGVAVAAAVLLQELHQREGKTPGRRASAPR